jgi:hypothetical protein
MGETGLAVVIVGGESINVTCDDGISIVTGPAEEGPDEGSIGEEFWVVLASNVRRLYLPKAFLKSFAF